MTSQNEKPFQFGLRSIFLATSVIALTLGSWRWFGSEAFFAVLILAVQCAAVVAIGIKSRDSAWSNMVAVGLLGLLAALLALMAAHREWRACFVTFYFWTLAAWFLGGLAADKAAKRKSRFLRWALPLAVLWLLIIFAAFAIAVRLTSSP
jgi:peptidoglycan/LPS O-acetylase OafA/YrhL